MRDRRDQRGGPFDAPERRRPRLRCTI